VIAEGSAVRALTQRAQDRLGPRFRSTAKNKASAIHATVQIE
jgi:hypothetical protein